MALTRKMLTAMGIESDKVDQIIESHVEVVDGLKKQSAEFQEQAAKVPALEKQVEELKASQPAEDYEAKYNDLQAEFDSFKAKVEQDKADAEKARLYRAMLREQGVDEKRIDSIMKVTDMTAIDVVDGQIADKDAVAERIGEEWGDFIPQVGTKGADVDTPPASNTASNGANPDTVKRLQERHERMYGKQESGE